MTTVITNFKCFLCEKFKGERHKCEVVVIEGDTENHPVCDACAEEILERRSVDSVATAVLEKLDLDGGSDTFMSNEGWGYCSQFGNWLYYQDDQGFRSSEHFDTIEKACKHFDYLHDQGWGWREDDAQITAVGWGWGKYEVWFGGKHLATVTVDDYENPLRRAKAIISVEMRKTGYFPNVWLCDDRNIRRIEVW